MERTGKFYKDFFSFLDFYIQECRGLGESRRLGSELGHFMSTREMMATGKWRHDQGALQCLAEYRYLKRRVKVE